MTFEILFGLALVALVLVLGLVALRLAGSIEAGFRLLGNISEDLKDQVVD